MSAPYLEFVRRNQDVELPSDQFPGCLGFVKNFRVEFRSPVTFFVGENGCGKSTVLEAIAYLVGLPVAGGSFNEDGAGHGPEDESLLARAIRVGFARSIPDAYFFRAEFQAHFASLLDLRRCDPDFGGDPYSSYGGRPLHSMSHGEAFLSVMQNRFQKGLFLLDEPESALSPKRQLTLLAMMHDRVQRKQTQFVIATHSPILLTYPNAQIVCFDDASLPNVSLDETAHFQITQGILNRPEAYWKHLRDSGDERKDDL
ncbi:MAG: AAA family ATPase [Planctomycetota bacterium]